MKAALRQENRRTAAIMTLMALILGLSLTIPGGALRAAEQVRVTTSFDARFSSAVLHQVARLFAGGFCPGEADRVRPEIERPKAHPPRGPPLHVQCPSPKGTSCNP